mmetsp:Transcript_22848/g.53443  ORF Transcript_22848/g.53443 Transcript_22848/m.53443 type:complete len:127 (-) Transcript_22848:37-417(-)
MVASIGASTLAHKIHKVSKKRLSVSFGSVSVIEPPVADVSGTADKEDSTALAEQHIGGRTSDWKPCGGMDEEDIESLQLILERADARRRLKSIGSCSLGRDVKLNCTFDQSLIGRRRERMLLQREA